jgi:L-asparaginase II
MLNDIGLTTDALQCPPDLPLDTATQIEYLSKGMKPERLTMNCSGKHAGMLTACVENKWSIENYLSPEHNLQKLINETIEDLKIKLRKLGVDERVAQAQIAQASRPGASAELVQTYLKNPEAFNAAMAASRPSSAGDTTALNRLRYADAALQNDLTYLGLSRSKKPAEQEKAKAIKDEIYARYGVTPSSNTQPDPLGLRGGR